MTPFQAGWLGVLQGVTEFLPISSSAHLVLLPWILGWGYQGLAFDVALHGGTLLALLLYFLKDWLSLLKTRLAVWIALATIPAAAAGYFLEEAAERVFRTPPLIALCLMGFGLVLAAAERIGSRTRSMESLGWEEALAVGLAQVLAIVPGVSRSGITLTAGLALGLKAPEAARFSFLLAAPILFGACLLKLRHIPWSQVGGSWAVGFGFSALASAASIHFLLEYLRRRSLMPFVGYRLALGLLILGMWWTR